MESWDRQTGLGFVFSSSTIFKLPNGANRSPDIAWIERSRWQALTPEQRHKFLPIAPVFVIELHSATDALEPLQAKLQEYLDHGVRLGWLINPQEQQVEIYRAEAAKAVRSLLTDLSGGEVLPGFSLVFSSFS